MLSHPGMKPICCVLLVYVAQLVEAFAPSILPHSSPRRAVSFSLRMADKGGGFGGWLSKQMKENMGQSDPLENIRKAVQAEEESPYKPDYNFKFANKFEDKLAQTDIDAAVAVAGKKKKKIVKQSVDGKVVEVDTRFFEVSLDRPTGIEFATDLSLKFVYIMEVKENSPAQLSPTPVEVGDQLVAVNGDECIGQAFGDVATLLGEKPAQSLRFRFFRGSKQELLNAVGREDYVPTVAKVKSIQQDKTEEAFEIAAGANLRDSLIENGVEVYNMAQGRFTNCNGKQLCGTCVVRVMQGAEYTNSKSIDEENFLRKLPPNYRLSCCVNAYGDIIVETRPPTGKKFIELT